VARGYGQYCGFARAVEIVAERWAFLIVRDLLVGPKRFTDLERSLAPIPTNVLTTRLKGLEQAGIVSRRIVPRPERGIAYELTPYGAELEEVVLALGRWGAKALGAPRPGERVTGESLVMALRTTFDAGAARKLRATFELRMGEVVIHARVDHGVLDVEVGPLSGADLVIEAGPAIRALMAGELTPAQALADGRIRITGPAPLLDRFVDVFRIRSSDAQRPAVLVV
jgi:DNA-binding HxlR family transcriptional regulator